MNIQDIKPYLYTIEKIERLVANQSYSFNETGQSFNEVGVQFGGLYGNDSKGPILK